MSTIIFAIACGVLIIIVISRIPGLEHFVKPLIDALFTLLRSAVENFWAWGIYLVKTLLQSHLEVTRHLLLDEDAIDPTAKMRKEVDGH